MGVLPEGRGEAGQARHLGRKVGLGLAVEQQPHNRLVPVPSSQRQASGSDLPEAQAQHKLSFFSLVHSIYHNLYTSFVQKQNEKNHRGRLSRREK